MKAIWSFLAGEGGQRPEQGQEFARRWELILALRGYVLGRLEMARGTGTVKAPREARAIILIRDKPNFDLFSTYNEQLPALFGISAIELISDPTQNDLWTADIQKAEGVKCARCWIYKPDVGVDGRCPDICKRCADAVGEWQAKG